MGEIELIPLMHGRNALAKNQKAIVFTLWSAICHLLYYVDRTVLSYKEKKNNGEDVKVEAEAKTYYKWEKAKSGWAFMDILRRQWVDYKVKGDFPKLPNFELVQQAYSAAAKYYATGTERLTAIPEEGEEREELTAEEIEDERLEEEVRTEMQRIKEMKADLMASGTVTEQEINDQMGYSEGLFGSFDRRKKRRAVPNANEIELALRDLSSTAGPSAPTGSLMGGETSNIPPPQPPPQHPQQPPPQHPQQPSQNASFNTSATQALRVFFDRHIFNLIPIFRGDVIEYNDFIDLFLEIVGNVNMPNILKLRCLKMKLAGAALELISSYRATEYLVVIKILNTEYNNLPHLLARLRLQAQEASTVDKPPYIEQLMNLIARVRGSLNLIIGRSLDDTFKMEVFRIYAGKVPWWMIRAFMEKVGDQPPQLNIFLIHLESELVTMRNRQMYVNADKALSGKQAAKSWKEAKQQGGMGRALQQQEEPSRPSNSSYGNQQRKPQRNFYGQQRYGGQGRAMQVAEAGGKLPLSPGEKNKHRALVKPCSNPKCGGDHSKLRCAKLNARERFDVARECKLCLLCLEVGHLARNCSSTYKCRHCNGPHHWLFCRKEQPYSQQRNNGGNTKGPNVRFQDKPSTSQAYQVAVETDHPDNGDNFSSEDEFEGCMNHMFDDDCDQAYNVCQRPIEAVVSDIEELNEEEALFEEPFYYTDHDYVDAHFVNEPLYEEEEEPERPVSMTQEEEEEFNRYLDEVFAEGDRVVLLEEQRKRKELDAEEDILSDIAQLLGGDLNPEMEHLERKLVKVNPTAAERQENGKIIQMMINKEVDRILSAKEECDLDKLIEIMSTDCWGEHEEEGILSSIRCIGELSPLVESEHQKEVQGEEEYDFCSDDSEFDFCDMGSDMGGDEYFCMAVQDSDSTGSLGESLVDNNETEEDNDEWHDASEGADNVDDQATNNLALNAESPTEGEKELTFVPVTFTLRQKRMTGMLDTGANINLFPIELATQLELPTYPVERSLNTPQGKFTVRSAIKVAITVGWITQLVEFLLYNARPVILLGTPILKLFRLSIHYDLRVSQEIEGGYRRLKVARNLTRYSMSVERQKEDKEKPTELEKLLRLFKHVFSEGGGKVGLILTEQCVINLTDKMPINQRPYRVTTHDQEIIDKKIMELLAAGIIRVSTSPYSFPVVLVAKKDEGEKSRFCVNYIKLNQVTLSELFPMPRIEDLKDFFLGAKWFTTVDISNGFYHIEVAEEDKAKTAFSTMTGHWEWNRMPFGLKNAPVLFQRVIANLLRKHNLAKFALGYIDDIVVFSKTYEEHLEHLRQLFEMVDKENIKLKLSKCQFGRSSVVYLGYQIERDSFRPLNSNTMALEKVAPPENVKSLRSFIGKVGFYQRFVPNRAQLLYPLYQLLKKGAEWLWDEAAQMAFEQVKIILTTAPVLHIFNPEDVTYLYTDASLKGLGAVLKQSKAGDPTGERFPIGFYSKTLLDHQKNYSVTELELLAIVMAIEFWHFYLLGHVFTIITDHQPLKAIQKFSKVGSRLFSWGMQLRQYNFRIEYIPGETNIEADFLSRHPINMLLEATESHSFWVEETRIKSAQQEYDLAKLPKRVRNTGSLQEKRLVYIKGDISKCYLPPNLALEVLQELHVDKGHIGSSQMELHFARKYHTQGLAGMLKELVLGCDYCARVKKTSRRYGTLGQVFAAQKAFDVIHIDTKSGFRGYGSVKEHLHLAIDGATRFVWSVESKTKVANDFINLINKVISIQKPKLIVADNYASIKGKAFREYLKERDIKIVFVSVNHQSANGLVERVNQTMMERMKCGRLEKPNWAWVTIARKCVEDYNRTIHTVTLYTPLYLLTGQDDDQLFTDETLEVSRLNALENSRQGHEKSAKAFDAGRKDPNFEEGDQVYVQAKHQLNRKALEPAFEGPFEVKGRIGQTTFEVNRGGKIEQRHVSQLKPVALPSTSPRGNQKFILANMALMIIGYFSGAEATGTMSTAGPIIWKESEHVPVAGYNYTTHVAILSDPCIALLDFMSKTNETMANSDWKICRRTYRNKVLRPIHRNCNEAERVKALGFQSKRVGIRHRRFVILAAIAIGIAVGLVSYGVMMLAHEWIDGLMSDRVDKIEEQLKEKMEKLKNETALNIKFQEKLVQKMKNDSLRMHHLENEMNLKAQSSRHLTYSTMNILEMGMHLEYLFHSFKLGKVSNDYAILFEDSPLLKGTPLQYWKPHTCDYMKEAIIGGGAGHQYDDIRTIIFRFEIPLIAPSMKILQADPFRIMKKNDQGKECLKQYTGSKFVIYDEKGKCTRDLLTEPLKPADLIMVDAENHVCISHQNKAGDWKTLYCGGEVESHQFVQYKEDTSEFYVYCYGHRIRPLGQNEQACDNVIYRIPKAQGFSVDGHVWVRRLDNYTSHQEVDSKITELINQRVFNSQLGKDDSIANLEKLISEEKEVAKDLQWDLVATHPVSIGIIGSVVAIVLIFLCVCITFRWKRSRDRLRTYQERFLNRISMKQLRRRQEAD